MHQDGGYPESKEYRQSDDDRSDSEQSPGLTRARLGTDTGEQPEANQKRHLTNACQADHQHKDGGTGEMQHRRDQVVDPIADDRQGEPAHARIAGFQPIPDAQKNKHQLEQGKARLHLLDNLYEQGVAPATILGASAAKTSPRVVLHGSVLPDLVQSRQHGSHGAHRHPHPDDAGV